MVVKGGNYPTSSPSTFQKTFSSTDSELEVVSLFDGAYGNTIQYEFTIEDTGNPDEPGYEGETGVTAEYENELLSIHVKYDAMDIDTDTNQYAAYPTIGELRTAINNLDNFEAVYSHDAGDNPDTKDFNVDYDVNPDNYPKNFIYGETVLLVTFSEDIDRNHLKENTDYEWENASEYFNFANADSNMVDGYIIFDDFPYENDISLPNNQLYVTLLETNAQITGDIINVVEGKLKDINGNTVANNSVTITETQPE